MDADHETIIQLLTQNARHSNQDIATMIGKDEAFVETAIRTMVETGVIRQFTTVVNDSLIDSAPIKALVELKIRPEKDTGYNAIARTIAGFQNVVSHYLISGKYDFLLVVEGRTHKDIAHFVFDTLATIKNVQSTTTHFIFKAYKEHGVLMESNDSINRIPVSP